MDLALRLPDGTPIRERVKAPVSGKSAALRWAQDREGQILAQKGRKPKDERRVPTLTEFKPRFIDGPREGEPPEALERGGLREHLSPAHKNAAIRLLDRRPVEDGEGVSADDNISRIKSLAVKATPAPPGAANVGDGLETSLRPEPESSRSVVEEWRRREPGAVSTR